MIHKTSVPRYGTGYTVLGRPVAALIDIINEGGQPTSEGRVVASTFDEYGHAILVWERTLI